MQTTTFRGNPPAEVFDPKPGSEWENYLPFGRADIRKSLTPKSLFTVNGQMHKGARISFANTKSVYVVPQSSLDLPWEGHIFLDSTSWSKVCEQIYARRARSAGTVNRSLYPAEPAAATILTSPATSSASSKAVTKSTATAATGPIVTCSTETTARTQSGVEKIDGSSSRTVQPFSTKQANAHSSISQPTELPTPSATERATTLKSPKPATTTQSANNTSTDTEATTPSEAASSLVTTKPDPEPTSGSTRADTTDSSMGEAALAVLLERMDNTGRAFNFSFLPNETGSPIPKSDPRSAPKTVSVGTQTIEPQSSTVKSIETTTVTKETTTTTSGNTTTVKTVITTVTSTTNPPHLNGAAATTADEPNGALRGDLKHLATDLGKFLLKWAYKE